MSCTAVFEIASDSSETPLLQFANGKVKKRVEASELKMRCFYSNTTPDGLKRKRLKKILVAENDRLQYTGYNFGQNAPKSTGMCRFYVGVHNKLNGTIKVLPSNLFHMKPHFSNDSEETNVESTYKEKRDNLSATFGSKRKRRNIELRTNNLVNEDSLKASVDNIIQETVVEKTDSALISKETAQPDTLPPRNDKASIPEEVYDLDSIIHKDEYNALTGYAEELCAADMPTIQTWKTECKYSRYVLSWIARLQRQPKNKQTNTALFLLYYDTLVSILNLRYTDLRKKDPLPNVPEPLKNILLEKFTLKSVGPSGKVSRSMPPRLKDKVLAHALVVALHIEDFTLELASIQMDLKIPQTRIITIGYALGCHVLTRKSSLDGLQNKVLELKIPLFIMNEKGLRKTKKK